MSGRTAFCPMPEVALGALSAQLGLEAGSVQAAMGGQLLCRSASARVVCRVAPELAPLIAPTSRRRPLPSEALRVLSAGCTLARRSRTGVFQPTVEGARALAPLLDKRRRLRLRGDDALRVLRRAEEPPRRRAVPLDALSPKAAGKARKLRVGPCLLLLQPADASAPPLALPARRLRGDALRLALPHTAGLESRPAAVVHAAKASLGSSATATAAT